MGMMETQWKSKWKITCKLEGYRDTTVNISPTLISTPHERQSHGNIRRVFRKHTDFALLSSTLALL